MLRSEKGGEHPSTTLVSILPGYPSQAGSKPGDVCRKQAPRSLWPLGAAGVQIPLPALFLGRFLKIFWLNRQFSLFDQFFGYHAWNFYQQKWVIFDFS